MNSPENDNQLDYIAPHIKIVKISVSDPVSFRPDPDPRFQKNRIRIPDLDLSKFVNKFRWNVRLSYVDS